MSAKFWDDVYRPTDDRVTTRLIRPTYLFQYMPPRCLFCGSETEHEYKGQSCCEDCLPRPIGWWGRFLRWVAR